MINKHKTLYSCVACGRNTVTYHEPFPGSSRKKTCEKYNIQTPLCYTCHLSAHSRTLLQGHSPLEQFKEKKYDIQVYLCDKLGIDRDKTSLAINNLDTEYLESINGVCEQAINGYEV